MIKFFRRIRQNLLSENKISKYLIYAIGEIVLVVIGILIALQINSWNSQNKLKRTNNLLMKKMQDELQININRIHYLDTAYYSHGGIPSGYTPILSKIDTALTYINEGLKSEHLIWMLKQPSFYRGNRYNLSNSVYQEMLNTGRFYTLGSDSLQNQIRLYYKLLDRESQYVSKWNEKAIEAWKDCKYSYNDLKQDYDLVGNQAIINHHWYLNKRSKNYLDLKIALRQSYISTERNRRHAITILDFSKSLKELLELEIKAMSK